MSNRGNDQQFIGIEIGGTKLQLVTGTRSGTITQRYRFAIDPQRGASHIQQQVQQAILDTGIHKNAGAIGVGFGGPVDWKSGTIQLSHQVGGWNNFNVKTWLQDFTGLPVAVDNDANTAALAEAIHGCGKGYDNVFYMTIGSGIGGGMIINQKIYHGRIPGEVEIGHTRLDKSGTTLESRCSGWAVNQLIREHIRQHPQALLATLAKDYTGPEAVLLHSALEQNDPHAKNIIRQVTDDLAFALSHVVHLFNPDVIIIGGGLSLLGKHLQAPLHEQLPTYLMKALQPAPEITLAALSEDAVPVGALELANGIFATQQTL